MPRYVRDVGSGALIIEYTKQELENSVGYKLMKLERKVEELEKILKELFYILKEGKEERDGEGEVGNWQKNM